MMIHDANEQDYFNFSFAVKNNQIVSCFSLHPVEQ
jgi:hypothetical protein